VPAKGGEHAYALLREALRAADRIGIAKFILRDTLHLAAVEVINDTIVLTLMRFADELVDAKTFALPAIKDIRKAELQMAKTLVESLAADWNPSKYHDEYRDNLMRIIQGKVKGKKVDLEIREESRPAHVVDLMERLRRSLDARGVKMGKPGRRPVPSTPARKVSAKKHAIRTRTKPAA
jgi:DNA end-binding protein Ku